MPRRILIMTDKNALRARLRAERDRFVLAARPAPIEPDPGLLDRLTPGRIIASFTPRGSEAGPSAIDAAAAARGCRMALPFVADRATPLRFLAWTPGEPLAAGPFGLANPRPDAEEVTPDLILAPLLGFDRALNRLGQGAGHYDRAFARHSAAWRVGLAWSVQEVAALPADPWDMPLHVLATEAEWITP